MALKGPEFAACPACVSRGISGPCGARSAAGCHSDVLLHIHQQFDGVKRLKDTE